MDINTWFESGCNYHEGITLYASLKGHSPNLLRLFLRKQTFSNAEKLKYELGKFRRSPKRNLTTSHIIENPREVKKTPPTSSTKADTKMSISNGFYRLNELHIDLHLLAQKQRADFQKAISKHLKLTQLHPDEESKALQFCIEIEDLFDAVEAAQKILNHYVKHKTVLHIEKKNFSQMTAPQLLRSRNNKSTSVSKYKKKVHVLRKSLGQNLSKTETTKIKVALEKAENKLLHHEMELQQLNELINGK